MIATNGMDLYYEIHGRESDPPVVIVPGFGDQVVEWNLTGVTESLVADGFRVILYDQRDAGLSTHSEFQPPAFNELLGLLNAHAAPPPPYTLDEMADDLLALLGSLETEGAHVIGHCIGGTVAMLAVLKRPDEFKSLVTVSSTADTNERLGNLPDPGLFLIGDAATPWYLPEHRLAALTWQRWVRSGTTHVLSKDLAARIAEAMLKRNYDPDGALRQAYAFFGTAPFHDRLGEMPVPTLVLHGTDDFLFGLEHPEDIAARIPNATMKIYEGAGHNIPPSLVPDFVADVSEFCRADQ